MKNTIRKSLWSRTSRVLDTDSTHARTHTHTHSLSIRLHGSGPCLPPIHFIRHRSAASFHINFSSFAHESWSGAHLQRSRRLSTSSPPSMLSTAESLFPVKIRKMRSHILLGTQMHFWIEYEILIFQKRRDPADWYQVCWILVVNQIIRSNFSLPDSWVKSAARNSNHMKEEIECLLTSIIQVRCQLFEQESVVLAMNIQIWTFPRPFRNMCCLCWSQKHLNLESGQYLATLPILHHRIDVTHTHGTQWS